MKKHDEFIYAGVLLFGVLLFLRELVWLASVLYVK